MDSFKDGKYIIGFLIGIICSFLVMGGIKNYLGVDDVDLSDAQTPGESQVIGAKEDEGLSVVIDKQPVSVVPDVISQTTPVNSGVTKPEDPHSPELQRLDLILREAGKMVDRMSAEINSATK
jgi:hypothetical protein